MRRYASAVVPIVLVMAGRVAVLVGGFGSLARQPARASHTVTALRVTTSRRCRLPQLPSWTQRPSTTTAVDDVAGVYEVTYIQSAFVGIASWQEQGWRFAVATVFGSPPTATVAAFRDVPWPGRGAVVWQNPKHWSGSLAWCTQGKAYHVNLRALSPSAAEVVARFMDVWTRARAASVFRCAGAGSAVLCRPVGAVAP